MRRIDRLRAAIDETAAWAVAASQTSEPGTPTGEHWRWECCECDTVIEPDPVVDEFVECPVCGSVGVSLRSEERYQLSWDVRGLPSFPGGSAEEVKAAAAVHIVRHDPAKVLRRCAVDRKLVDMCGQVVGKQYENAEAEARAWLMADVFQLMIEAYGVTSE
jgi:hypothetical protein